MSCSGLSFVPNVSGLALHQWSYKERLKRYNVGIHHERKKKRKRKSEFKPREWLVTSWKIRRISRRFRRTFFPQSIIPRTRATWIEWPALLKYSATGTISPVSPSNVLVSTFKAQRRTCLVSLSRNILTKLVTRSTVCSSSWIMFCRENVRRKRLEMRLIFQFGTSHLRGLKSEFRFL